MNIAVIGDIHGNNRALEVILRSIKEQGIEHVLFLGDFITDCPGVRETLDLLKQAKEHFNTYFIRGNREEYMLNYSKAEKQNWFYGSKYGSLLYSYDRLTKEDLDWFESLPISRRVKIEGLPEFEICHGSMTETRVIAPPGSEKIDEMFVEMNTEMLFCAHLHMQFSASKEDKTIVNCGSAGIPNKGSPLAEYLVADFSCGEWNFNFMKCEYDVEALARDFYSSGFIEKANVWARSILTTLKTGRDHTLPCVDIVEKLARERAIPVDNESLWEEAARILGV